MMNQPSLGQLLKDLRRAAGLTQEELAVRAQLSTRAISDLERGVNHAPRATTVQLLIGALGLSDREREHLAAAARAHELAVRAALGGGRSLRAISCELSRNMFASAVSSTPSMRGS